MIPSLRFQFIRALLIVGLVGSATGAGAARAADNTLVVLGDSLSAGYGIEVSQGWVSHLRERLSGSEPSWNVINASISGYTTDDGLVSLPGVLDRHDPSVVIVELGANDGLRGQPPKRIRANLASMLDLIEESGADAVLVGIRLPPNYGARYLEAFEGLFGALALERKLPLVPFLLDGVAANPDLMQADGLHPTAAAQRIILENIWAVLRFVLEK